MSNSEEEGIAAVDGTAATFPRMPSGVLTHSRLSRGGVVRRESSIDERSVDDSNNSFLSFASSSQNGFVLQTGTSAQIFYKVGREGKHSLISFCSNYCFFHWQRIFVPVLCDLLEFFLVNFSMGGKYYYIESIAILLPIVFTSICHQVFFLLIHIRNLLTLSVLTIKRISVKLSCRKLCICGFVDLCYLMTSGSERTFGVMYDHTFQNLQITRSDIRPHIKWAVSLVTAYGPLIFLRGLCGVNMLTQLPPRVVGNCGWLILFLIMIFSPDTLP